eukprot:scaffold43066_cov67-Phaeocystis_antarctica.AAC.2
MRSASAVLLNETAWRLAKVGTRISAIRDCVILIRLLSRLSHPRHPPPVHLATAPASVCVAVAPCGPRFVAVAGS